MPRLSRRALVRSGLTGVAGVVTGVAAARQVGSWFGWDRPPLGGGYAAAADDLAAVRRPGIAIRYFVETTEPMVALTFDDGPAPHWTPMVLDALDAAGVPATFFMVGRNLAEHADLVRGRLERHEVGNHSWSHDDLATLDLAGVCRELQRAHEAILEHTGRTATLLRPPYGHLGGSTVLAADRCGYDIVLWSEQTHEKLYRGDPDGQARHLVDAVRPGAIILAHDAGDDRRRVTVDGLATLFAGLRARGFRFVTVSQLVASAAGGGVATAR